MEISIDLLARNIIELQKRAYENGLKDGRDEGFKTAVQLIQAKYGLKSSIPAEYWNDGGK